MPIFNWMNKFKKEEPQSYYLLADFYHDDALHETALFFSDVLWEQYRDRITGWKRMIDSQELISQLRPQMMTTNFVVMKLIYNVKDPNDFPIYLLCYSEKQEYGWFEDKIFAYTYSEIEADGKLAFLKNLID